jgi:lipopolysaccharide transport system permease protein
MDEEARKVQWDVVIGPARPWWRFDLKELWHFRDLLVLFVKRDLLAIYKQTVLGPLWQVLQPLLTSLMFAVVFGFMARMSQEGMPPMLFYLAAVVPWSFFANVITRTSQTLVWNATLMSRVYFPRLLAPMATTLSTMVSFFIQLAVFFIMALIYRFSGAYPWAPNGQLILLPVLILLMTLLAFSAGILVAALTTKFRDLTFLLAFGIQLLMFISPVIFPLSMVEHGSRLRTIIELNPMTPVLEGFRAALLGTPMMWGSLTYTTLVTAAMLVIGLVLFQRVQRSFADVI